jgi:hypothetical protein
MVEMGLEFPSVFPAISADRPENGAHSGAPRARSDILALAGNVCLPDPPPDLDAVADPLLTRFLEAWHRLDDADRRRLVDDAERLADACCDALDARPAIESNIRP